MNNITEFLGLFEKQYTMFKKKKIVSYIASGEV